MPQIIVTAGTTPERQGIITLRERVNASDFESECFAANLVERLGWAVLDAVEVEEQNRDRHRERPTTPHTERTTAPEADPEPQRELDPVGVA